LLGVWSNATPYENCPSSPEVVISLHDVPLWRNEIVLLPDTPEAIRSISSPVLGTIAEFEKLLRDGPSAEELPKAIVVAPVPVVPTVVRV
jgi:hypothetical protein